MLTNSNHNARNIHSPPVLTDKELGKSRNVTKTLQSRSHEAGVPQVVEPHQPSAHTPGQISLGHAPCRYRVCVHGSVVETEVESDVQLAGLCIYYVLCCVSRSVSQSSRRYNKLALL